MDENDMNKPAPYIQFIDKPQMAGCSGCFQAEEISVGPHVFDAFGAFVCLQCAETSYPLHFDLINNWDVTCSRTSRRDIYDKLERAKSALTVGYAMGSDKPHISETAILFIHDQTARFAAQAHVYLLLRMRRTAPSAEQILDINIRIDALVDSHKLHLPLMTAMEAGHGEKEFAAWLKRERL